MLREAVRARNGDPCMLAVGLGRDGASLVHRTTTSGEKVAMAMGVRSGIRASNVRRAKRGGAHLSDLEACGRGCSVPRLG